MHRRISAPLKIDKQVSRHLLFYILEAYNLSLPHSLPLFQVDISYDFHSASKPDLAIVVRVQPEDIAPPAARARQPSFHQIQEILCPEPYIRTGGTLLLDESRIKASLARHGASSHVTQCNKVWYIDCSDLVLQTYYVFYCADQAQRQTASVLTHACELATRPLQGVCMFA